MKYSHNVEIVWDELLNAFADNHKNKVYFLDKNTGEVFFIPSNLKDDELWHQMESNAERFLEIPAIDYNVERQLYAQFMETVEDEELKLLLDKLINSRELHGNLHDILSFFPEEEERLESIKDDFLSNRVQQWLEVNNLFTMGIESLSMPRS